MEDLLEVAQVAKRLDVTPNRVRQLADSGRLPHTRTLGGTRLFRLADVEAEVERRANRRAVASE